MEAPPPGACAPMSRDRDMFKKWVGQVVGTRVHCRLVGCLAEVH